jgi:hypothetical protein
LLNTGLKRQRSHLQGRQEPWREEGPLSCPPLSSRDWPLLSSHQRQVRAGVTGEVSSAPPLFSPNTKQFPSSCRTEVTSTTPGTQTTWPLVPGPPALPWPSQAPPCAVHRASPLPQGPPCSSAWSSPPSTRLTGQVGF